MKNILLLLLMLPAFIAQGQIDNLSNMSPEWVRTGNRNAAVKGMDRVIYNPASLTQNNSGFQIAIGNQMLMRKPSHTYDLGYGSHTYKQDGNDFVVPDLLLSYSKNNWALWGGAYISGGGATANYPNGSINTELISLMLLESFQGYYTGIGKQYLKASSLYLTGTAGVTYNLNEQFGVAVGVRYVNATNKTEAGTTLTGSIDGMDLPINLKSKDNAAGIAAVIGLHARPFDQFNVSVRLETNTKLNFKTTQQTDDLEVITAGQAGLVNDGEKHRRDLPGVAAIGLGYDFSKSFRFTGEINYYFQQHADWGRNENNSRINTLAGDAINYAGGFEWQWFKQLTWSAGAVYTMLIYNDMNQYYTTLGAFETAPYENLTLNTGFAIDASEKVRINLGVAKAIYKKDKSVDIAALYPNKVKATLNNDVLILGAGIDFRF